MLIELVATIAIIVLMLAFAFPRVPTGTGSSRMLALVTSAVSLLREARTEAIAHGVPVGATFDPGRRALRAGNQTVTIPADVDVALTAGGNCPTEGGRAKILFRPDGTNCGGVLRLAGAGRIVSAKILWVDGQIDVAESR